MTLEDRVKNVMADILDLPASQITVSTTKEDTETWDSLAQINVASALEAEFNVTFRVDEIEAMTSYATIVSIISEKF